MATDIPPGVTELFEAQVYQDSAGEALPYRLLKPLEIEAGRKYPLVIFLHGAGERGSENARQLIHGSADISSPEMRGRNPAFVLAPQCPAEQKWVDVDWDAESHTLPEEPGPAMKLVIGLVDQLQESMPIDSQRIYGVGLSMGGFGTWDLLARKPDLLAAAVPVCGGADPATAERIKQIPIWAFHGAADEVVKPKRSRDMVAALEKVGGNVIYTEYEGVGHNSWGPTFGNRLVWDWLFAQRKK